MGSWLRRRVKLPFLKLQTYRIPELKIHDSLCFFFFFCFVLFLRNGVVVLALLNPT